MPTREEVKETVRRLFRAGKKLPQESLVYATAPEQRNAVVAKVVNDTIDLIYTYFGGHQMSHERWESIEHEAILSNDVVISPAMIQNAINKVNSAYSDYNMAQAEKAKAETIEVTVDDYAKRMMWEWTKKLQLREQDPFPEFYNPDVSWQDTLNNAPTFRYMPHPSEVTYYLQELGARDTADNRMLVKIYLNDCNYSQAHHKKMTYLVYLDDDCNIRFTDVDAA